jgi:hypothetical protein
MSTRATCVFLFGFVVSSVPAAAQNAKVKLAQGLLEPASLGQDSTILNGRPIRTEQSGLVLLEFHWPDANATCRAIQIISGQHTTSVKRPPTSTCTPSSNPPANLVARVANGDTFEDHVVFWGQGKSDGGKTNPPGLDRILYQLDGFVAAHSGRVNPRVRTTVVATPPLANNVSGIWRADDGGTYYVRQVGDQVWWFGESADGKSWANVYNGKRTANRIDGSWADVPKGTSSNSGKLALDVVDADHLRVFGQPGAFGGKNWTRLRGRS